MKSRTQQPRAGSNRFDQMQGLPFPTPSHFLTHQRFDIVALLDEWAARFFEVCLTARSGGSSEC